MKKFLIRLVVFIVPILAGLQIATAQVAQAFQYHPALGAPLVMLGGVRWYRPWAIAGWLFTYGRQQVDVFRIPMLIVFGSAVCALLAMLVVTLWQARTKEETRLTTHGSARWGTEVDLKRSGLLR